MNSDILFWDWKEHPNEVIDSFKDALKDFGINVFEIDTQSDSYAVVIGDKDFTEDEANNIYEKWMDED